MQNSIFQDVHGHGCACSDPQCAQRGEFQWDPATPAWNLSEMSVEELHQEAAMIHGIPTLADLYRDLLAELNRRATITYLRT